MHFKYIFFIIITTVILCRSGEYEYVYPIAVLDNERIMYMHQINATTIRLLSWNSMSDSREELLWSMYTPIQVKILPHKKGFSFIDNGRLRIQLFQKRSPKAVDFDDPIYNINTIEWLDEHMCYCSAQYNNHSALFQLSDDGTTHLLIAHSEKDYVYPQKVNASLFFIERSVSFAKTFNYCILKTEYHTSLPASLPEKNNDLELIIDFQDKPIIFLTMISEHEGFVIEHQKTIHSDDSTTLFSYHHIFIDHDTWIVSKLFSFHIPTCLFLPGRKECLFESIIPLLPKVIDNKIFFVDCTYNENNFLELYYYDLEHQHIKKLQGIHNDQHYFIPIRFNNELYVGGSYTQENSQKNFLFSIF